MQFPRQLLAALVLVSHVGWLLAAELSPVSEQQEQDWLSRLIPLPKQIAIQRQAVLPEGRARVRTRIGAGEVEKHAAAQLRTLLGEGNGGDFEIFIGLLDDRGFCAGFDLEAGAEAAG